jgi:phage repressor protein C with HTH and peptisase S24 domain
MSNLAFYIQGNSMSPTLYDSDMVICSEVPSLETIEENELYAIVTTTGAVIIKRLRQIRRNGNSQIVQLNLLADNEPVEAACRIPISKVRSLLKIEQHLSASA